MNTNDLASLVARAVARRVAARERLDETFGSYRVSEYGSSEGACAHCMTRDEFDEIAMTPVAELTREQVWSYVSAVWTGTPDFKRFLPRLLELVESMDELVHWDLVERKLPPERWFACSDVEREVVAGFIATADEYARILSASDSSDVAELLKPMMVPARIADGLPLAQSMWPEFASLRARVLSEHLERCREATSPSSVAVLARALNGVVEGEQKRELKARLLAVVPSDDVLLAWMRTEEPERLMSAALASGLDDDTALCVGTALSNLALLAQNHVMESARR